MSDQSREIFEQELYRGSGNPEKLLAAAYGHIGASRRLEVVLEEYVEAMADQAHHTPEQADAAQKIADELAPIRSAHAVVEGYAPPGEED